MDFFSPLPNGYELLVVIDEYSRMPVISEVKTTAAEFVLPKLDDLFAFVGKPEEVKTDNGPPFNGSRFQEFSDFYGFKHRKITPEHPQANGLAEKFMLEIGAVIRNARTENKDWRQELNAFLRSYRSTPHSTTGIAPSVLLFGANRTNRLPSVQEERKSFEELKQAATNRDTLKKMASTEYTNKTRRAKTHNFKIGEAVLLRQKRTHKFMTAFNESKHIITDIKGSMISVKTKEGKEFTRDAARFRRWFGCQEQRDPNVSVPVDSTGQLQVQEEQSSLPLRAPVIKETDLRRSTRIKQPPDFYRPVNCNTKFLKQRGDVVSR